MKDIKTILLIGRTGKGKSTLANVISGNNKFEEGCLGVSKTRKIQTVKFEENKVNYHLVDTPGIGDTKLSEDQVLDIIAEAVYLAKDGISQVFFVTNGRFDQYEMLTYDILRKTIFDESITNYTTIVRTYFEGFKKKGKCEEDINLMINKGGELAEVIKSCQTKVVHVSNPPIEVDDFEELEINKNKRAKSRKVLLKYLEENCQEVYKSKNLKELGLKIIDRIGKKVEIANVNEELGKNIKELRKAIEENKHKEKESWKIIEELSHKKEIVENSMQEETNTIRKELSEHIKNKSGINLGNILEKLKIGKGNIEISPKKIF